MENRQLPWIEPSIYLEPPELSLAHQLGIRADNSQRSESTPSHKPAGEGAPDGSLPRSWLLQIFLMPPAAQKNIGIGFDQEKETVISGNPSLKDIVKSRYNITFNFFDAQGRMMRITH
jgi:hypothetical protein